MNFQLPELSDEDWRSSIKALQQYSKVVASFSSQFIPYNKIRKENTLKVSHRGLTTQSIPYYNKEELIYFEMEIDFNLQSLWVRAGEEERQIPFRKISEYDFYFKTKELLNDLGFGLKVELNTFNDENQNTLNYEVLDKILRILHFSAYSLKRFRSELSALVSSVQFRPQQFDIVMYISNGRTKNTEMVDDGKEFMTFGFSFGDKEVEEPHFFATVTPFPKNLVRKVLEGEAQWHKKGNKKAILSYSKLLNTLDPFDDLLSFYGSFFRKTEEVLSK